MVQLKILSGKTAGGYFVVRRFPVRIGRARDADLKLDDDGVWDHHLLLNLSPAEGFSLTTQPPALARVNSLPVQHARLRNGDVIDLGSLSLQFLLAETRQSSLSLREAVTWITIGTVCLGQIGVLYWLLR